jgi:hypothetical protein
MGSAAPWLWTAGALPTLRQTGEHRRVGQASGLARARVITPKRSFQTKEVK